MGRYLKAITLSMPGVITPEVMPELQRVPSWKGAAARQKARRETRGLKQQQAPHLPAPPTIPPLAKAARPGRHTNKPPPPKAPSKSARQAGGYIAAVRQHARESVTQHDTIKRQQQQVQQQELSAQATHDTAAIVAPTKKRPLIRVGAAAQQEEQRQRERERKLRRAAVMKPLDCSSRPSVELKPMRREEVMQEKKEGATEEGK